MPRASQVQARSWCFTTFETRLASELAVKEIDNGRPRLRYLIFQTEKCPDTDRHHLQGYVQFKDPVRFNRVKIWIGDPACHIEKANGTADQNRNYCTKEDSRVEGPWEVGEPASQGQRTDLEGLHDAVRDGTSTRDLWEDHFPTMVRYHRAIDAYRLATRVGQLREPPDVRVYWGPTGTGKTRRVYWETGGTHFTVDPPTSKGGTAWFDGYDGQEVVLIDDYSGEYNIHFFKRLLDRYPMTVQVKGGYTQWMPTKIYITSNTDPAVWYGDSPKADRDAVARRLNTVEYMGDEWSPLDAQESPDLV